MSLSKVKILTLFGTRPEVIKLAPVIQSLERQRNRFITVNVSSTQHSDLLYPFIEQFGIRVDHHLRVMQARQKLNGVCSRVLAAIDPILSAETPDVVLVQGDTTTALAGALAGFHHKAAVCHVEAGLRSGNVASPFPEEMNRRLISRLASLHFAATESNRETLLSEGVADAAIFVTGNPVVDSLTSILESQEGAPQVQNLVAGLGNKKLVVLTTHRRESFGDTMSGNLRALRDFVERHDDTALVFPVHPNPAVRDVTRTILSNHARIKLLAPLGYLDFIRLLAAAWLIVSDSGGIQEEAPTLGKPLLVLRENTERPEAIQSGVARLVGGDPNRLGEMLDECYHDGSWNEHVRRTPNPFGSGDSGVMIANAIAQVFFPEVKRSA